MKNKRKPKTKKQYCKRGHDTFVTGRDVNRECTECRRARKKGILDSVTMPDEILQKIENITTKFCPRCDQIKEKTEFFITNLRADGFSGYCKDCSNLLALEWKHKNRDYHNAQGRKWHIENKEHSLSNSKKWRIENPEKKKLCVRNWSKRNKAKRSHNEAKRRMGGKIKFGQIGIVSFYQNKPDGMEVDHIIPLVNDQICGLHVRWNLQYLSPKENIKKSNKVDLLQVSEWYGNMLIQLK